MVSARKSSVRNGHFGSQSVRLLEMTVIRVRVARLMVMDVSNCCIGQD